MRKEKHWVTAEVIEGPVNSGPLYDAVTLLHSMMDAANRHFIHDPAIVEDHENLMRRRLEVLQELQSIDDALHTIRASKLFRQTMEAKKAHETIIDGMQKMLTKLERNL